MRIWITIITAILCVAVLISGKMYWKVKTTISIDGKQIETTDKNKKTDKKSKEIVSGTENLFPYMANWPDTAQKSFQKAVETGNTYTIAIIGSNASGAKDNGWSTQLQSALIDTFGEETLNVTIMEHDLMSAGFIDGGHEKELANALPDLVLFEPFILKDNGNIPVEENHENILQTVKAVEKENPEVTFILQPSYPIYNASIYPNQVKGLKEFATDNKLTYLDHWTAWPDSDDEKIKDYLQEKQNAPNEKGHELWANYLIDYFIAK